MTTTLRLTTGCAAMLAGVCLLTAADLPKESTKAAAAADAAEIKAKADAIAAAPEKSRSAMRTVKGLFAALTVYGDEAAKGQAAHVVLALEKKDYAGAAAAAKAGPKADAAAVKSAIGKIDLEDIMNPFKLTRVAGLGMEKDIRDAVKGTAVPAQTAALIGVRSAALAELTAKMPNDKAKTNPGMTAKWERWAKDMAAAGKELADEAGKPKADAAKLTAAFKKLDASCSNCHNDFRNE